MFPIPRYCHSANYDKPTERLLIFGGYTNVNPNFNDQLCILELKNFPTIIFQTIKSMPIPPRCKHTSFVHNNRLYIYGGIGINKITKKIRKVLYEFRCS